VTYPPPPPQRRPPSKYLALWISLPIVALLALCGGVGAALDDDEPTGTPQPVASLASPAAGEPSSTPSPTPPAIAEPTTAAPATTSPPATRTTTTTTRPAAPPTTRTTTTKPPTSVYYRTCADAKAAGAAPLYRGDPGYRPELDRDRDGVACES
jgi:hypothetical protein